MQNRNEEEEVLEESFWETVPCSLVCCFSSVYYTQSLTFLLSHSLQVSLSLLTLQMLHERSSKCPVDRKMKISSIWLKISYVLHIPFTSNQWIFSSNVNFSFISLSNSSLMNSYFYLHQWHNFNIWSGDFYLKNASYSVNPCINDIHVWLLMT